MQYHLNIFYSNFAGMLCSWMVLPEAIRLEWFTPEFGFVCPPRSIHMPALQMASFFFYHHIFCTLLFASALLPQYAMCFSTIYISPTILSFNCAGEYSTRSVLNSRFNTFNSNFGDLGTGYSFLTIEIMLWLLTTIVLYGASVSLISVGLRVSGRGYNIYHIQFNNTEQFSKLNYIHGFIKLQIFWSKWLVW